MAENMEEYVPGIRENGITTNKNINTGGTLTVGSTSSFTGLATFTAGISSLVENIGGHASKAAINSTAAATAAQVATGYITSTSAAPTTITLPTGTLLGAALGASQGTVFNLYVDNTAGASTVTIAVAVNGIISDAATTTAGSFGQLTVAAGITGIGRFTIMFASATAYVFTRTA